MNRNEMLNGIFMQFEKSAHAFCDESKGIYCQIANEYKGIEQVQNLKWKTAKIYYNAFVIEFVYTAHGVLGVINSILSCNVYLDKAENSVGIPLPLMTDYCGMDVKEPLCIPFITNAQGMLQAFRCTGDVLNSMLPAVAKICADAELLEELQQKFHDELQNIFQIEIIPGLRLEQQGHALADFFVNRFSSGAFHTALCGNYGKASKQLGKIKNLTGYEKRMQKLWLMQDCEPKADLSAVMLNAKAFSGTGTSKVERKEFAAAFIGWIAMCPAFSAIYLGLYGLLVWIEGWNSVYLMGPMYNFPYCFLAGFITAIAFSYFTRFFFYKRLFKKDYAQFYEMDSIQNVDGSNKLMKGFLVVIVTGCITLCVLLANWNLNFLQDGFVDNTKFLSLKGEFCAYNEVEYVYYKPDRVNGYGETLDYPSYVIVLKDGHEIDLYEHGEISEYSGELIDFFRDKGIEIK